MDRYLPQVLVALVGVIVLAPGLVDTLVDLGGLEDPGDDQGHDQVGRERDDADVDLQRGSGEGVPAEDAQLAERQCGTTPVGPPGRSIGYAVEQQQTPAHAD